MAGEAQRLVITKKYSVPIERSVDSIRTCYRCRKPRYRHLGPYEWCPHKQDGKELHSFSVDPASSGEREGN